MNAPNPNDPHGLYKTADTVFRSDRHPLAKIVVAGGLGLLMSLGLPFKIEGMAAGAWCASAAALIVAFSSVAALFLLADRTRRKLKNVERVGLIARVFFGAGISSVLIWIVIAFAVGSPLAIWMGGKSWKRDWIPEKHAAEPPRESRAVAADGPSTIWPKSPAC